MGGALPVHGDARTVALPPLRLLLAGPLEDRAWHEQDLSDARAMLAEGFVEPERLRELFAAVEPDLARYPALDPASFRSALEDFLTEAS